MLGKKRLLRILGSWLPWLLAAPLAPALEPVPDRLVVLTFDDAVKSHFTVAREVLKRYGFGATFFITEGFTFAANKKDYMTWEEIRALHRDGFEIGNHTRGHMGVSPKTLDRLEDELSGIDKRCEEMGIPKPSSFAWPGNAIAVEALPVLKKHGLRFARRGGSPEYPYEKGRGLACKPGLDHPLLIPSAGDARPDWTLADFIRAAEQAREGRIAVLQFHGVPEGEHPWVHTPRERFEEYMSYLHDRGYKAIALRDLARYADPDQAPADPWEIIRLRKEALGQAASASGGASSPDTVRDRLWVWAHEAGVYNGAWGLPGNSRITPVEGAHWFDVPNLIFIRYEGKPAPPFEQYAVPFRSLKRVYWSIAGAGGATSEEERQQVWRLAASLPNCAGLFMDDFFRSSEAVKLPEGKSVPAALSIEELKDLRGRLNLGFRKLDLGVTLYTHQLEPRLVPQLELCEVISLWTWKSEDLKDLEANLAALKKMVPDKRLLLGCYLWDFGNQKPMPLERLEKQCELGLRWLLEGRIEGIIFLATNLADLNLEAVEWARAWIERVGGRPAH